MGKILYDALMVYRCASVDNHVATDLRFGLDYRARENDRSFPYLHRRMYPRMGMDHRYPLSTSQLHRDPSTRCIVANGDDRAPITFFDKAVYSTHHGHTQYLLAPSRWIIVKDCFHGRTHCLERAKHYLRVPPRSNNGYALSP